jgi:hypothetical protein
MKRSGPDITAVFEHLRDYVEARQFRGWDPYDALLSPFPFARLGHWTEVLAIQANKRLPINLRPLLGIPPRHNPKSLGLFLEAYALLAQAGDDKARSHCDTLLELLQGYQSKGFSGACWGYPFPWSGPRKQLPVFFPSTVVTAMVVRGIHRLHKLQPDPIPEQFARSIPAFLLHDLPRTEDSSGLCFSYTPAKRDICYNASLFAAESLARCDAMLGEKQFIEIVGRAVDFVLARQKKEGWWMYSEDPESGAGRKQTDFHQGFILDSLFHIRRIYGIENARLEEALRKGAAWYFEQQFSAEGRSLRRLPRKWPADIHAQAQGILSFSLLKDLHPAYGPFAETIARWTIDKMYSSQGYFYYQRYPLFTIRTPFMRWAQAWMMNSLVVGNLYRDEKR